MEEQLDPSKFSRVYLEQHGFGVSPLSDGKILMLCPLNKLKVIPIGTPLTNILGKTVLFNETHAQPVLPNGKTNPFFIDKDYRYYGGSIEMLAWGIVVYQ